MISVGPTFGMEAKFSLQILSEMSSFIVRFSYSFQPPGLFVFHMVNLSILGLFAPFWGAGVQVLEGNYNWKVISGY